MFSLFIFNFGFEGRTLVPISSDPDHCLYIHVNFTFSLACFIDECSV